MLILGLFSTIYVIGLVACFASATGLFFLAYYADARPTPLQFSEWLRLVALCIGISTVIGSSLCLLIRRVTGWSGVAWLLLAPAIVLGGGYQAVGSLVANQVRFGPPAAHAPQASPYSDELFDPDRRGAAVRRSAPPSRVSSTASDSDFDR